MQGGVLCRRLRPGAVEGPDSVLVSGVRCAGAPGLTVRKVAPSFPSMFTLFDQSFVTKLPSPPPRPLQGVFPPARIGLGYVFGRMTSSYLGRAPHPAPAPTPGQAALSLDLHSTVLGSDAPPPTPRVSLWGNALLTVLGL